MPSDRPYRYHHIRPVDYYDLHRIADKLDLSYTDTLHLLITEKLRALGLEPTDLEQEQDPSED
jgi:hypothetical protein